jgi:hypothetical protein
VLMLLSIVPATDSILLCGSNGNQDIRSLETSLLEIVRAGRRSDKGAKQTRTEQFSCSELSGFWS